MDRLRKAAGCGIVIANDRLRGMYQSAAAETGIVPPELGISATQRSGFIFVPVPLWPLCLPRLPTLHE
jgi:hypothetical protein